MNNSGLFQREKRYPRQMYHPMHQSIANYWTETFQKSEMKHDFNDDLFLNNIHLIPDPLKKNLADSLFNTETPRKTEKMYTEKTKMEQNNQEVPSEKPPRQTTTLGGIGNFFSGVMNVLTSVMFRSRATNYYDCFDVDSQGQAWQHAKTDVQDKNGQSGKCESYDVPPTLDMSSDMNIGSREAVTGCERKLNQVRHLLAPKQSSSPVWVRKRPKKVFVEPGSVEESFEDAFSPEDFCSIPNDSYIEYYSPMQYQCEDLYETAAQKTQLNKPIEENMDLIKEISKCDVEMVKPDVKEDHLEFEEVNLDLDKNKVELQQQETHMEKSNLEMQLKQTETKKMDTEGPSMKEQLVSSCEDKLSRLKALLQEKRNKCRPNREVTESKTSPKIPNETKSVDKHYKNPKRRSGKRPKNRLKCRIEDDLVFANEISIGTPPSVENSPRQHNVNFGDYFDEVSGRFRTTSTGSDDSFQIVFNEPTSRLRKSSDCDSEDSFIVFEDSPESCYVSNDVFDSDSESEMSDSENGVVFKLAHTLTRTVGNLADDSLYESEDEVDFGIGMESVETDDVIEENTGLLLTEKKKQLRKSQPTKKVHFSTEPPKVRVMRVWAFAARQARAGHWERYALDRERFKRRIADMDMALSWVLKPQHRGRVMFQRFMPWWNQLKRKELAEKKEREAEEKRQKELEQQKENELEAQKEKEQDVENQINEIKLEKTTDVNSNEYTDDTNGNNNSLNDNKSQIKEVKTDDVKINENTNDSKVNNNFNENKLQNTNTDLRIEKYTPKNDPKGKLNKDDNGKISNLIIADDKALAKKIRDLEVDDTINSNKVSS